MTSLILLGQDDALTQAVRAANACGLVHTVIELKSADRHNFELDDIFARFPTADSEVFVALDARAVNYARHKLVAQLRLAGYRLANLISPTAIVDDDVRLAGNVYIGPGCNVAPGTRIGVGCWLDRQVVIESDVRLGACTTLHAGVSIGRAVDIGQGSTLGSGSIAGAGTKIGRHCEWLLPGVLPITLPDRSFYDALMPQGARIL
ncbi:acetyltransferase [Xanthomonas euvesicatoria pv. euvesicatoria]|uniref:Acetyltransferase n=3 Tax=Xanthomonas euvesicatoria TaxID=456327 RepID=Q3BU26_XANE5|nr:MULTISPECIES: acetyltransferase [Xanthomonas]WVK02481.1 acetyltransferase [Xanthomonas campestris pv. olitorii]AOY65592.1 acetyltransferase [Xanthomonas euvesicatoria pv. vesicatoria str. 85-10]APO90730.1 acetyltransferase [Xanthomonas euvesicatoria]KHL62729.1 acetyltransferase [Xanthomonas euvesicatoria]KHL65040.1 acetyltransferase [Xanthomonas euvesicatoria]